MADSGLDSAGSAARDAPEKRSKDAIKQRQKYADRVPVICVDKSNLTVCKPKPVKLLVPNNMAGADLRKIVLDKAKWPQNSILKIGNAILATDCYVSDLDKMYQAEDGFLYIDRHARPSPNAQDESVENEAAMSPQMSFHSGGSPTVALSGDGSFLRSEGTREPEDDVAGQGATPRISISSAPIIHLPDRDAEDIATIFKEGGKSSYRKVLKKYPDKVPVRFMQSGDPEIGLPFIDKKLLVPEHILFSQFGKVASQYVPAPPPEADVQILVADIALEIDAPMSELYEEHKARDGLLYMRYGKPMPVEVPKVNNVDAERALLEQALCDKDAEIAQLRKDHLIELEQMRASSVRETTEVYAKQMESMSNELERLQSNKQEHRRIVAEKDAEISSLKAARSDTTCKVRLDSYEFDDDVSVADLQQELAKKEEELREAREAESPRKADAERISCLEGELAKKEEELKSREAREAESLQKADAEKISCLEGELAKKEEELREASEADSPRKADAERILCLEGELAKKEEELQEAREAESPQKADAERISCLEGELARKEEELELRKAIETESLQEADAEEKLRNSEVCANLRKQLKEEEGALQSQQEEKSVLCESLQEEKAASQSEQEAMSELRNRLEALEKDKATEDHSTPLLINQAALRLEREEAAALREQVEGRDDLVANLRAELKAANLDRDAAVDGMQLAKGRRHSDDTDEDELKRVRLDMHLNEIEALKLEVEKNSSESKSCLGCVFSNAANDSESR